MARKFAVEDVPMPAAPQGAAGANDLAILSPDLTVDIGGETVTVREYRFFEGLQLLQTQVPFFDDLYATMSREGARPGFYDVMLVFAKHEEGISLMVAKAIDRDIDWVRNLRSSDGEGLMLLWWEVNGGFFIRTIQSRAVDARLAGSRSDGAGSTTP
jgi:hypothetical protein